MRFSLLFVLCIFSALFMQSTFAAIDLSVTPIRYEITADPGDTITKTAKIINNTNSAFTIIMGKSDFQAKDTTGNPVFVRKSELVNPNQELASWITLDTNSFILPAKGSKEISFTINVPSNATPGGHYGAVFFKHNNAGTAGSQIGVNVDYGVLVLVKINGEVITKGGVSGINISNNGNGISFHTDMCLVDLTSSPFDGRCFDDLSTLFSAPKEQGPYKDLGTGSGTDFNVTFHIPFQNGGNTHIKPEGKIILTDETNKPFEKIGKEIIKDENGSVIGEKIVDYLPLNDQGGNILPNTTRDFNIDWIGFPYKSYDDKGNEVIKYRSPSEYFTLQNLPDGQVILMPWERIAERAVQKNLTAKVNIAFSGTEGKTETIDLVKEFTIDYKEKYIAWSPYALILMSVGGFFLFYFFIGKKRRKNSYPHMKYLAGKYFYNRWKDAYANSLEVIYDFRENEKPSRVAGLVENIERFIENHANEHDLDKKLLSFFKNMNPKDENLTPKEWLLTLHNFLINHTPKRKRGRPRKYFES